MGEFVIMNCEVVKRKLGIFNNFFMALLEIKGKKYYRGSIA